MQFNVAQQLKGEIGTSRSYELDSPIEKEGCTVHGEVTFVRTERGILVRGKLSTMVDVVCSRCLEPFSCPVTFKIEEEFFPTMDVSSGTLLHAPDDPFAFTIDKHNTLDLSEAVRQSMLLAIPMKPLCRPDCAGLCPYCGANLNRGPCECAHSVSPSRTELKTGSGK